MNIKNILILILVFTGISLSAQQPILIEGGVKDTTFKFNTVTDKFTVSSPSNKGFVDINKGITINPDTLLTSQTFLKVNAARSSPHTYAPFGFVVDYANNSTLPYKNYVWTFGPNAAGNTGLAFEITKPMAAINWETSWDDGGIPTFEWHEHWKQPDSSAIRLKSYTIRYQNALSPTTKTNIDLYHTADAFYVKSSEIYRSNPTYWGVIFNKTTGLSEMSLATHRQGTLKFSGFKSGSVNTFFIQPSGTTGTSFLDVTLFDGLTLNGLGDGYTKSTRSLVSNNVGAITDLSTGSTITMPSSGAGKIMMGSTRWITCGTNQTSFFAGYGSGPTSPTASNVDNIGIGYIALNSLSSVSQQKIAIGSFADRYATGNNTVVIGSYARGSNTFASATKYIAIGDSAMFSPSVNPSNKLVIENSPSNTPLLSGDFRLNRVGINTQNYSPNYTLDIRSELANTSPIFSIRSTTDSAKVFVTNATPNSLLTGRIGDLALGTNGGFYFKKTGSNTNTGWVDFAALVTESTTIGAFQSSGNSNGLTLSGTDIRLHAATVSTPGGVNVGLQTFGVGADTKVFNGTGSGQITVDGNTDNTPAGINFTQQGTDLMGIVHINSSDVDNARLRLALEQDGGLTDQVTIGTLNDNRGFYSRNGLYEDVTAVTTSPYTVLYGDRNIYLDGITITVNLQAIGTSAGETKVGRVIYFFNDNATNVTITPNGSETINDSASLTLLPNTGVTLLAVTGTKWVTRD